jgi:DNA-binding response OmpR family regulator
MPKVLIIEDRRENIVFLANNILKPMGYEIITAMDGQTGLLKAQEENPDLIITDLKLPRMSGLQVLAELEEQNLYIPTIVMTFHGTEDTAMRALRLGARDYLIKPFTIEEMQEAIQRASKPRSRPDQQANAESERLKQELVRTQAILTEREEQLKRLSSAAQMVARVPELEQEITELRAALADREDQPNQQVPADEEGSRDTKLEQALAQTRKLLAQRENQLRQAQRYVINLVKKVNSGEGPEHSSTLKEENARLNEALIKAQRMLMAAEKRAGSLEEMVTVQKDQMEKYYRQADKLGEELRNLSQAVRLLSQDLSQQAKQLENSIEDRNQA